MADAKISALVELTPTTVTNGDWLPITDTSATQTKKIDADAFVWSQKSSAIYDDVLLWFGSSSDDAYLEWIDVSGFFKVVCRNGSFYIQHDGGKGSGNIYIDNDSHGYNTIFTNEDAGGTNRTLLTLDPDLKSAIIGNILNFADGGELTISGGVVTITSTLHSIDTEADAASDDLDTITGISNGDILIIDAADDARTVVVKHGTGNLYLNNSADFSMNNSKDKLTLIRRAGVWHELNRSNNGA